MDSDRIDSLLERYLSLLDEYTTLRESLSKTQTTLYQNLARANFSAERGVRYGPDYYDDRMQASRTLSVSTSDDNSGRPRFDIVQSPEEKEEEASKSDEPTTKSQQSKSRDPLRWFGILAPMPLRQAQAQAVIAVETVIPRLVTVDAEMKELEIQIRRARKKRAKAEAAKDKVTETTSQSPAVEAS